MRKLPSVCRMPIVLTGIDFSSVPLSNTRHPRAARRIKLGMRGNMDTPVRRPYRHGNLPNAMRAAARAILDEGGPESVGLRETARRVGVSATAAYRHFASKEELLASVAAEGFRELRAEMEAALNGHDALTRIGLAYVEFALRKRGLFRLMFGPILVERARYPVLNEASRAAIDLMRRAIGGSTEQQREDNADILGAWGLVHGLSSLFIDDLIPEDRARALAEEILVHAQATQPESRPAA